MVANLIGAGIGLVGSLLGKRSSSANQMLSYKNNIKYYDYTRPKELADQINLMRKERDIQKQLMSTSAKSTQALNQNLMDYQYALERQSRQTSYNDTRKDLESAGYNPLLAVGQQSGYTSVGSGVSADSQPVETSELMSSAVGMARQVADVKNQIRNTDITDKASHYLNQLNQAKTELTRSEASAQDLQNTVDSVTKLDKAKADLDLTRSQKNSLEASIQQGLENIKLKQQEIGIRQQEVNSANSLRLQQIKAEKYNNAGRKKQAEFDKSRYGQFLYGVSQTTGAIGNVFGASAKVGK